MKRSWKEVASLAVIIAGGILMAALVQPAFAGGFVAMKSGTFTNGTVIITNLNATALGVSLIDLRVSSATNLSISISNITGLAAIVLTNTSSNTVLQYKDGDCAWGLEKGGKLIITGGTAGPATVTNRFIVWLKYLP